MVAECICVHVFVCIWSAFLQQVHPFPHCACVCVTQQSCSPQTESSSREAEAEDSAANGLKVELNWSKKKKNRSPKTEVEKYMYWSFPALDTSCSVSCVSYYHTSVLVNIDKTAVCQAALCKWECCMEGSPGIIMLGGESFCSEELSLWRQEDLTLEGKGLEKQPRICVMGFSLLWVV